MELKCPKCGSLNVRPAAGFARALPENGKPLPPIEQPNQCLEEKCGYNWSKE